MKMILLDEKYIGEFKEIQCWYSERYSSLYMEKDSFDVSINDYIFIFDRILYFDMKEADEIRIIDNDNGFGGSKCVLYHRIHIHKNLSDNLIMKYLLKSEDSCDKHLAVGEFF